MLDAAVALYRARLRTIVARAFAVVVPVQVVITLIALSARRESTEVVFSDGSTVQVESTGNGQLGASFVILLLVVLASQVVTAAAVGPLASAYTGLVPDRGRRMRLSRVAGVLAVVSAVTLAGFAMCVLPGVALFTLWSVAIPVVALEDTSVFRAIGRSQRLVGRSYLRALGLVATASVLTSLLGFALGTGVNAWVFNGGDETAALVVQGIANALALSLSEPLLAAALVTLYFDVRIRHEGFDVQVLMQRNDARHLARRSAPRSPVGPAPLV